jgi:D-arabinose 1-dehydrogenase-like Zn-dependent alcohol dehydrogenase
LDVQGIGGLGHLGIQFAWRMGFRTVAITRGSEKGKLAKELGTISYIDAPLSALLVTLPSAEVISSFIRYPLHKPDSFLRDS